MSGAVHTPGVKTIFAPNDHEVLVILKCKANGVQLQSDNYIREINLYDTADPGELFMKIDEKENIIYVFTKVKKRCENGQNVNRKVSGDGVWRGLVGGESIHNEDGREVGLKRTLTFQNKEKKNLGYRMTEFVLDKKSLEEAKFKDYVLCKIKRNPKKVSIGIRGAEGFRFQENPFDNTTLGASSTAGNNSRINNGERDFAGLSYPPQNICSQFVGEQNWNAYCDPRNFLSFAGLSDPPQNICSQFVGEQNWNAYYDPRNFLSFAGLSDPPQNICSQFVGEQNWNAYYDPRNFLSFAGLSDPPQNICSQFVGEQNLNEYDDPQNIWPQFDGEKTWNECYAPTGLLEDVYRSNVR